MNQRTTILAALALGVVLIWTGFRIGRAARPEPVPQQAREPRATPGTPIQPRPATRRTQVRPAASLPRGSLQAAEADGPAAVTAPAAKDADGLDFDWFNLFPKPMYEGTPAWLREWPEGTDPRSRGSFEFSFSFSPRNLSRNRPVTGSDPMPIIGELDMLTDGDKLAADGSWVELAEGVQFVQVDLERECEIVGVALWHLYASPRIYHDVQVWIGSDDSFTNATAIFNNDADDSLGLGAGADTPYLETHKGLFRTFAPVTGRYVRAYSRGSTESTKNQYVELEVYGR